jgi:hypothetical protein
VLTQLRSFLTYANVMATFAVFVALGGTSYAVATGSIDGREIRNNTVRSKDIRNNDVTTRDLKNNSAGGGDIRNDSLTGDDILESSLGTVPSANSANTANTASSASTATTATTAGTATTADPRLFAHINPDGSVDATRSKQITSANISHDPNSGSYCISGLGFTPRTIVGTVDSEDSPGVLEATTIPGNFKFCPTTAQIELATFDPEPISFRDFSGGFYIWVN